MSTCCIVVRDEKEYTGRIKMIEDGIMDKLKGIHRNGTDVEEVAFI